MKALAKAVAYSCSADAVNAEQLQGFIYRLSDGSVRAHVAAFPAREFTRRYRSRRAQGPPRSLVTAINDGVSAAYLPHLEVLPDWHGMSIGSELMRRMLVQLAHLYVTELVCDPGL